MLKNWCSQIVVLEKTLESLLDYKEMKPVNPEGNQPGIFTGRTDAKAEASILQPPHVKNWLTGKDPDAGKDWGQEKGTTEDEMVGWYHWLNGHEWANSGRWWTTGKLGGQRRGHNSLTEQQQKTLTFKSYHPVDRVILPMYHWLFRKANKLYIYTKPPYWQLTNRELTGHLTPLIESPSSPGLF